MGHFHGSRTVAQLFLHSGPAWEEKSSRDIWRPTPSPPPTTTHPPPPTAHHPHRLSDLFLPLKDFQMGLIWRIESSQASSFKMQECKKSIKVGNLQQLCCGPITDLHRSQGRVFLLGELEGGEKKQEIDGGIMYSLPCR